MKGVFSAKKILRFVAFFVMVSFIFYPKILETGKILLANNKNNQEIEKNETRQNSFDDIILEARAAYVFDLLKNQPIFDFNAYSQLPLASLTKIMTAVVASESLPEPERVEVKENFERALIASSNEDAMTLAMASLPFLEKNFVGAMNDKAKDIGLNQTHYLNETGLDISQNLNGGYGSAADIVKLMKYFLENNPELSGITTKLDKNKNIDAPKTLRLIASKTGYTDLSGGNLAVVFDAGFGHPIAVVVLGSSKEGRFTDVQKLIEATFSYLANS